MRPILRYILLLALLFSIPFTVSASESTWNGYLPAGSTEKAPFTPYYVAHGAKSYDCMSKLLLYSGNWSKTRSTLSPVGVTCQTTGRGASMTFTFQGCSIEWFGGMGADGGNANVFIDGKYFKTVSSRSDAPSNGQRVCFISGLGPGKHTFTIKLADGPGFVNIQAIVVQSCPLKHQARRGIVSKRSASGWELLQNGTTGVAAMQLAIVSETLAIIIDKVEHNPLTIYDHPAWATLIDINELTLTPLDVKSNSFCASGSFLSNGTLVNVGGNPVVPDNTGAADFGDTDGLQAIRIFNPCDSVGCKIYENHARLRLASPRWYSTSVRLDDGSVMIIGGSTRGGWINNVSCNNPTLEYFPPKDIHGSKGLPIHLPFLKDTLNSNLFPIVFLLPDGKVFLAANNDAMIYDWRLNIERRLPSLPSGIRVTYPMSGTAILLPLSPADNYSAQILICGGSNIDEHKPSWEISSQDLACSQCFRMLLTDDGISRGWEVENMPGSRIMPDAVLLPTGEVVLLNGGETGIAGYGNVKDRVGESNADNPALKAVLYNSSAAPGQRFSSDMPRSEIPRLYHSVATLTPRGDIMIAGSNPNLDRSEVEYGTEYRIEWLLPPYMRSERPIIDLGEKLLPYKAKMTIRVKVAALGLVKALMDLGFVTHSVHANSRLVFLSIEEVREDEIIVKGPPSASIYPPGPGYVYVVVNDVPSMGQKIMVGDGQGPPVDEEARNYVLTHTSDAYSRSGGE